MKIKFITLNIWHGGMLFDKVVEFLQHEQPDIITMQEVYDGIDPQLETRYRTVTEIVKKLNFPHYAFASCLRDITKGMNIERGNAVFSRYPLKTVKEFIIDGVYADYEIENTNKNDWETLPRMYQEVEVVIDDKKLLVHNIHGIWGTHGDDTDRRLEMSRKIVEEVKGKKPLILAGDFNVNPTTETIRGIEQHLHNVFKDELKTSFNMRHKTNPGFANAIADMVFVSDDIVVLKHYCPDADISDHFPLVAELEL